MKAKAVIVGLAALLMVSAGTAWAVGPEGGPPPGGPGRAHACHEEGGWAHSFHHHFMGPSSMWMIDDMGPLLKLGLNDQQLAKARTIHQDLLAKNLELHGKVMEAESQLPKLYGATVLDAKAIGKVYGRIFGLYQEMIQGHIEAHNAVMALLDAKQRERYERYRSGMMMLGPDVPPPGPMGGMGMGPGWRMGPGMMGD